MNCQNENKSEISADNITAPKNLSSTKIMLKNPITILAETSSKFTEVIIVEEQLIYEAIEEIAEALGDSNTNPLSTSLLCLRHGINNNQKEQIVFEFYQVLRDVSFDDLTVLHFRNSLEKIVPEAKDYADVVVIAFIKAYARNYIAELVPFARTLD